jgi:hypothetical protein
LEISAKHVIFKQHAGNHDDCLQKVIRVHGFFRKPSTRIGKELTHGGAKEFI